MNIGTALAHVSAGLPERATKRRKIDDFKPGFILKVIVQNFTTYSYAEFNLSPSLNMIIGPNGTGKSTLISAICLGLGGKLELIKRKTLKSMIKSGTTSAMLEVTLKNVEGQPNLVIRREFTEKESKWTVNQRPVNEKSVRALVKSLNIQLDNLCHFLPQERVAEFAGLSPEKLLLEIERTLGNGHLREEHEKLIQKDNEVTQLKDRISSLEGRLETISREKEEIEQEAQRFKEYQEVVTNLDYHQKLIPYVQLSDMKKQQESLKFKRNELKKKMLDFEKAFEPMEDELRKVEDHLENVVHSNIEEIGSKEAKLQLKFGKTQQDADALREKIDETKASISNLLNRSKNKLAELDTLRAEKAQLTKKYNAMQSPDEDKISKLQLKVEEYTDSIVGFDRTLDELQDSLRQPRKRVIELKEKMQKLQEKMNSKDRLHLLEPNRHHHQGRESAFKGHTLLRQHQNLKLLYFEAPVVCCTANPSYAHYVEKIVDDNTLFSITVTSSENYKRVTDVVFKSVNVPIRKVNYRPDDQFPPKPNVPVEDAKRFGFDGYLIDFVEGPKEVLTMLCDISKLHTIPVSKNKFSQAQINRLTDSSRPILFNKFIAGDTLFILGKSKYASKQVFYSTDWIRPQSHYFTALGLTAEAKQYIAEQIKTIEEEQYMAKQECHKLQDEIFKVESEKKAIKNTSKDTEMELEELYQQKNAKVALADKIENRANAIRTLERESKADYTLKIEELRELIVTDNQKLASIMNEAAQTLSEIADLEINKTLMETSKLQCQNKRITLLNLREGFQTQLETLREEYQQAKSAYDEIKNGQAAQELKKQSAQYTQEDKIQLGDLVTKYRNEGNFNESFVRRKIQILDDERALKATADQSSLATLQRKLAEITKLEHELPDLISKKDKLEEAILIIKGPWEEELSTLVNNISIQFNKYFTKVASDGRVELYKSEKYQDWKLHILVKFRQESELKILDHQSQSGGERAVSTIFFIMSLQGMTDAPFRVVDEINQGMDPKNEKMAHRYLVHTACQSNASQYFLVTPKLLTGLYYHPSMVVHCIYTGPLIDPVGEQKGNKSFIDFVGTVTETA